MQQATSFGRRGVGSSPNTPKAVVSTASSSRSKPVETTAPAAATPSRFPWVTYGLMALLGLAFWLEQAQALTRPAGLTPGYRSLVAMGGVNARLVFHDGQFWRIFTAPFLHASLAHIVGNAIAFRVVGAKLERRIGGSWLLAVYAISGVGGSLASILIDPLGPVSVGASGAIMGILAAAFVCSFHIEAHPGHMRLRMLVLYFAVPALWPHGGNVDYSAHFGGAVAGCAMGFLIQVLWPETEARPGVAWLADTITAVVLVSTVAASTLVWTHYPTYAAREVGLIPDRDLPRRPDEVIKRSAVLLAQYPADPRAHFFRAEAYLADKDFSSAAEDLRVGLAETDVLEHDMPPSLRVQMSALLAAALLADGRPAEARDAAKPFCKAPSLSAPLAPLKAKFQTAKLCD